MRSWMWVIAAALARGRLIWGRTACGNYMVAFRLGGSWDGIYVAYDGYAMENLLLCSRVSVVYMRFWDVNGTELDGLSVLEVVLGLRSENGARVELLERWKDGTA
ncbi:hypothetical protein BU23DRAFT_69195 [Bimuria novae-zelandiae CBS 107.79]|uniref:Uncharacterized protein n=1 Tax=Bimuria novae-zelandiae CBS 107.79 TaxID=1447943 RepID=A0A6A5VGL4_9PLEO|nr:hypothetical protein BU23DRAFT_69195 [Bimuria novae-zelandiae CBS 107.79]